MKWKRFRLSPSRRKFMNMMAKMPGSSISEIARKAKVPEKVYYRMLEDPELATILPDILNDLVAQRLIPLINSVSDRALQGSAKHAELIFKISKLIGPDGETKVLQVFNRQVQGKTQFLTDQEINGLLALQESKNDKS